LIPHHSADADPARFGQGFEARRDIDTVAKDVVLVDDDVAKIDADAEIDAPLGRHVGVARGHLTLHLDRATNRIDHARELAEQTIARRMDDAAPVLLDLGVGYLAPQHFQRSEHAFLIHPHQARIAHDVGRQNCRQAPLDPFLRHRRHPIPHIARPDGALVPPSSFTAVLRGCSSDELRQRLPELHPPAV
jgi:hypothetical protein